MPMSVWTKSKTAHASTNGTLTRSKGRERSKPWRKKTRHKKQDASKEKVVAVAEEHKTQVAVNNHGKTNEATKQVKEPLKKGQTAPTAEQKQKQDENKQKKSRGRKM